MRAIEERGRVFVVRDAASGAEHVLGAVALEASGASAALDRARHAIAAAPGFSVDGVEQPLELGVDDEVLWIALALPRDEALGAGVEWMEDVLDTLPGAAPASRPAARAAILERRRRYVEASMTGPTPVPARVEPWGPTTCLSPAIDPRTFRACLSVARTVDVAPPPPMRTLWGEITLRIACPFCGHALDPTFGSEIACACGAEATAPSEVWSRIAVHAHDVADDERAEAPLSVDVPFRRGDEQRIGALRLEVIAREPRCPSCGASLEGEDELRCPRECALDGTRGASIPGASADARAYRPVPRGAPYRAGSGDTVAWSIRFRGPSRARIDRERETEERRRPMPSMIWEPLPRVLLTTICVAVAVSVGALAMDALRRGWIGVAVIFLLVAAASLALAARIAFPGRRARQGPARRG